MKTNEDLVKHLVRTGVLKREDYIQAFLHIDRKDFMWPGYEDMAYSDSPAPLGDTGQTISAPHMNAYAMEILQIDKDDIILEIGAGSGYQAAVIGMYIKLFKGKGHIYTIEYLRQLYEFAEWNITKTGLQEYVTVIYGDGSLGWPPKTKKPIYNKILVSAAATKPPKHLLNQLKEDGKLLCPIGRLFHQTLYIFTKKQEEIHKKELFPVAYVPLKEKNDD